MMSAGEINFSGCRANTECKAVLEKIETACHANPAQENACKNQYMDATGMPRTPNAEWKAMGLSGADFYNWQGFLNSSGASFHGQTLAAPPAAASASTAAATPAPAASASASVAAGSPPPAAATTPVASSESSSSAVAPLMLHATGGWSSGSISFDSAFSDAKFGDAATTPHKIGQWGIGVQAGFLFPVARQFSIGPTLGYSYSALQPIEHTAGRTFDQQPKGGLNFLSLGVLGGYAPISHLLFTGGINGSFGWGHVMAGLAGGDDSTKLFGIGGTLGAYGLINRHFAIGLDVGYDHYFTGNQQLDSDLAANKSNNGSGGLVRVGLGIMGFIDVTSEKKD